LQQSKRKQQRVSSETITGTSGWRTNSENELITPYGWRHTIEESVTIRAFNSPLEELAFEMNRRRNGTIGLIGGISLSGVQIGLAIGTGGTSLLLPNSLAGAGYVLYELQGGEEGGGAALTTEPGRGGAFAQAKRDAGIPVSQQPDSVSRVEMTDPNGKVVLGENGKPIMTREYLFTRADGSKVIIQDHSAGHDFGRPDGRGNQGPHFNVRPADRPRHGEVPGTKGHYPFTIRTRPR
jgi:hypothetical protein